MATRICVIAFLFAGFTQELLADERDETRRSIDTTRGDSMIAAYFADETRKLSARCLSDIESLEDWNRNKTAYRQQLFEMLGLDPLPERSPLNVEITGRIEHEEFFVENVQFQSRPGLYVTGNLYTPKNLTEKVPAILYVCGHARVKEDDISFGNKTAYQHHGGWFARNGYVCLTIDTLQLGEIEGIHHGTYRYGTWWWNSRGYTPSAVEAWNCIRSLDYLQTLEQVDPDRIGVTGRSGGGAYSWWIAALDERIKAAVPVAGITTLQNHVVDGCVEGHCDCMYVVNTYRWDYAQLAALVAPRPLLISNSDKDRIFPLDGVVEVYSKVRRIYGLHDALPNIGLQITEGPHKDTQELRIHAFHWFNRHLKGEDPLIETTAVKFFEPKQLQVFSKLPADERNTTIDDSFVPQAPQPDVPDSKVAWKEQKEKWMSALQQKCFAGWPDDQERASNKVSKAFSVERNGVRFAAFDFDSQSTIRLRLYVAHRAGLSPADLDLIVLNVLDDDGWSEFLSAMQVAFREQLAGENLPEEDRSDFQSLKQTFESFKWGMAYVAPRGVGPTAWDQSERKQVQHRRRFMLLGQTLDGMRVWDARRAVHSLRSIDGMSEVPIWLQAEGSMAGIALYTALFEPRIRTIDLYGLPTSHHDGPYFLNVLRFLDIPQTVAMTAERTQVRIYQEDEMGWEYPKAVAEELGWNAKQIDIRKPPSEQ